MRKYTLEFHPAAKKELDKLDPQTKIFIIKSLETFIDSYYHEYEMEMIKISRIKKLKGQWEGFYRLRLRNYRIIYEKIEEKLIIYVLRVAHRKESY